MELKFISFDINIFMFLCYSHISIKIPEKVSGKHERFCFTLHVSSFSPSKETQVKLEKTASDNEIRLQNYYFYIHIKCIIFLWSR